MCLEPLSGYLILGSELYIENSKHRNQAFNFGPDSKVNKNVGELLIEMEQLWDNSPGWINKYFDDGKKEAGLLKLSCDKANINLEWYPVMDFKETVKYTISWYLNFYFHNKSVFNFTNDQINQYTLRAKESSLKWAIK